VRLTCDRADQREFIDDRPHHLSVNSPPSADGWYCTEVIPCLLSCSLSRLLLVSPAFFWYLTGQARVPMEPNRSYALPLSMTEVRLSWT